MSEKFLSNVEDLIVLGNEAMRQKNWGEATKLWALMREKFPENPRGYIAGSAALKESKNFEAADTLVLAGLDKFPKEADLYVEYGDIAMRQKKWKEASKRWALMRERIPGRGYISGVKALKECKEFENADALVLEGIKKFPQEPLLYIEYGDIAVRQKNWSEAVKRWALMREKFPENPRGYIAGSAALKESKNFEAADTLVLAGLDKFPKEANLYVEYGDIAMHQKKWKEASKRWALMRERIPGRGYISGVKALKECKEFENADALILEGIKKFPQDPLLYIEYGDIAVRQKNWSEAVKRWALMREKFPENPRGYINGCYALCHTKSSVRFIDAENLGQHMMVLFPNDIHCRKRFVENAMSAGNWPDVYKRGKIMNKMYPDDLFSLKSMIIALRKMNKIKYAELLCNIYIYNHPNNYEILSESANNSLEICDWENLYNKSLALIYKFPQMSNGYILACRALCKLNNFIVADRLILNALNINNINKELLMLRYIENSYEKNDTISTINRCKQMLSTYKNNIKCLIYLLNSQYKDEKSFINTYKKISDIANQAEDPNNIIDKIQLVALKAGFYIHDNIKLNNCNNSIQFFLIIKKIQQHIIKNKCKLLLYKYPRLQDIVNKDDFDTIMMSKMYSIEKNSREFFSEISLNKDYLNKIYYNPKIYKNIENVYMLEDYSSDYVNIHAGMRMTCFKLKNAKHDVHIYGNSVVYGPRLEDKHTIPSQLQLKSNKYYCKYNFHNHGIPGLNIYNLYLKLINTPIKEDDIVVIFVPGYPYSGSELFKSFCLCNNISLRELSFDFIKQYKKYKRLFFDNVHLTERGNALISDIVYDDIVMSNIDFEKVEPKHEQYEKINNEYNAIGSIFENIPIFDGRNGSIVMNCNPITNGHMHLISLASQIVNHLYIFVVEEDKSFFKFKDRFNLVKMACKTFDNVIVVPSGKLILSSETFPEYFTKSEKNDIVVDTSNDIRIFGKYICKHFNISIRFAGEEPIDNITRQYNEAMKQILPLYGVQFIEIPRKTGDDGVISASYVRKLMKEKQFYKIKPLVPYSTYQFIIDNFSSSNIDPARC